MSKDQERQKETERPQPKEPEERPISIIKEGEGEEKKPQK